VKNNMQVISSLLSLQSHSVTDKGFLKLLTESQNRVKSMAMIHERLYRSGDFASINFTEYIRELAASLIRSYSVRGNVTVAVKGEAVGLAIDKAVPCGLIVNELVSNALKYAFPNGGNGEITVCLRPHQPSGIALDVIDNGIGIGEEIDLLTANSLGLRLVSILINQVKGSMHLDRSSGTRFSFTIPG
jgi:two-component sensor histidine kinase